MGGLRQQEAETLLRSGAQRRQISSDSISSRQTHLILMTAPQDDASRALAEQMLDASTTEHTEAIIEPSATFQHVAMTPDRALIEAMDSGNSASSSAVNRKNGKLASCESCRKAKVRCDHSRPTCARCLRRGALCVWHPAPLTRPRNADGTSHVSATSRKPSAILQTRAVVSSPIERRSPVAIRSPQRVHSNHHTPQSKLFEEHPEADATYHKEAQLPDYFQDHHAKARRSVSKLVSHLRHCHDIEGLVKRYYAISPFALVPNDILLPALEAFRSMWEEAGSSEAAIDRICEAILANVAKPVETTSSMTPSQYINRYIRDSPRLEVLGLVYTLAARSILFNNDLPAKHKLEFMQTMYHGSTKATELARKLLPQTNDFLVWLIYENLLLNTQLTGDASLASWRRMGELATEVMSLGMHRNSTYTALPWFLAQTRRRMFAIAYNIDKFIASLIERPPRISKSWMDFDLPLDLPEAVVFAETPPTSAELSQLVTPEGWNVEPVYSRQAWARLRFIVSSFREDILEVDYRPWAPERMQELREISQRCHDTWERLPPYLRYTSDCWTSGIPTSRSTMLTTMYLLYKQLHFMIWKLMEKDDPSVVPSLLQVCDDLLNALLNIGASRGRASFLNYDYAYLTIAFGIPSALRLAAALSGEIHNGISSLPKGMSRAALIRKLSVFVASLESLHELGEMDKKTSAHAAKVISEILDDVLAPPGSHHRSPADTMDVDGFEPQYTAFPRHNAYPLDLYGEQDWTWNQDIDFSNLNSDWVKF